MNDLEFPEVEILRKKVRQKRKDVERYEHYPNAPKWYPSEDVAIPKRTRKTARPQKLRASLIPGTVLILLAGRFRGKRVVYLKHLEDNTLLITGPFKVNGVPLRRVNARYVIATSTKVSVEGVNVEKFNVEYFAKEKLTKKEKKEANLFPEQQKKEIKTERVEDQKVVDKALLAEFKKTPLLKQYLSASFSLKNGDKPHLLKF
ncbi:60S ribosomal protein L6A [Saccharomyces pastorianus]|uniref:60S ribosomal protein L6 n=1 Tax=Saccharomyces pastorianus TaxID=27292 RepID=A0A6C1ECD2_SACPS|nr:60S ribosomal protein L6A [Saccharomyces pastorianus]